MDYAKRPQMFNYEKIQDADNPWSFEKCAFHTLKPSSECLQALSFIILVHNSSLSCIFFFALCHMVSWPFKGGWDSASPKRDLAHLPAGR